MNAVRRVVAISLLTLASSAAGAIGAGKSLPPEFSEYPVSEAFSGPVASVDLTSHPDARHFRTILREGAKSGPNFAGHYTVVLWGCGTNCQQFAIIEARSGRILEWRSSVFGVSFRKNSRLLILNPITENEQLAHQLGIATDYLAFRDGALQPIGKQ